MQVDRRLFCAGAVATCILVGETRTVAGAAASATRRFDLVRAGTRIGRQTVSVSRSGSQVIVGVDVDIAVRIIGVPFYRYTLSSQEVWDGGKLMKLDAVTNANGSRQFAAATRGPKGLAIKGSAYSGFVVGDPGTTTYWSQAFLKRPVWVSTQDGRPLSISARSGAVESFATPGGLVKATRWRIGGDLDDLDLFYDRSGEWIGSEFQARGETVRIVTLDVGAALGPLWVDAA